MSVGGFELSRRKPLRLRKVQRSVRACVFSGAGLSFSGSPPARPPWGPALLQLRDRPRKVQGCCRSSRRRFRSGHGRRDSCFLLGHRFCRRAGLLGGLRTDRGSPARHSQRKRQHRDHPPRAPTGLADPLLLLQQESQSCHRAVLGLTTIFLRHLHSISLLFFLACWFALKVEPEIVSWLSKSKRGPLRSPIPFVFGPGDSEGAGSGPRAPKTSDPGCGDPEGSQG